MPHRRAFLALLLVAAGLSAPSGPGLSAAELPARLSDQEFWRIIDTFSEPSGTFHSENFVSNEGRFQLVLPELIRRTKPGRLYVGVGPEQNFTYMVAVRPRMAFIIDIRRGNLHEQLLYKALMELSADRAEFLSRLFSRPRPATAGPATPIADLFAAFEMVRPTEALYKQNFDAVIQLLTKKHALPLPAEDIEGIDFVYHTAFFADGPELGYRLMGQGRNMTHPTYAYLMSTDDGAGVQRSYLASEANFLFLKDLQSKNLIVPVVGDFGGTRALPAIAKYARDSGTVVSAFYLSNVEQYLRADGTAAAFCATVATMPLDETSTFIRGRANGRGIGPPMVFGGTGMFWSVLGEIQAETRSGDCNEGGAAGRGRFGP